MGLTIHFEASIPITENIIKKLQAVRQKCMDLPFEEVSDVKHQHITKEDIVFYRGLQRRFNYPFNSIENLKHRDQLLEERGLDTWTMIMVDEKKHPQDYETATLDLWAGEGCEGTNLIFSKKRKYWRCKGFTKTQYAEQFVKCHLLVIRALDLLKEQGFEVKVKDEGHYWKTRDLEVLAQNINDYTTLIKNLFGTITTQLESNNDIKIVAPIEGCENYMVVKDE